MDFLEDTGAVHSVLKQLFGKLSDKRTIVVGATGQKHYPGQLPEQWILEKIK